MRPLDAAKAAGLDRAAAELGVATLELMAVAGFQCARLARRLLAEVGDGPVAILCGRGNNGGDALVAARHLAGWGVAVRLVVVGDPVDLGEEGRSRLASAERLGLDPAVATTASASDAAVARALEGAMLALDGLLGTGGRGDPREPQASAIRRLNRAAPPRVLAIDLPSGLDASSGHRHDPCVMATDTGMLGAPKAGCLAVAAATATGRLWLGTIGLPPAAFEAVGAAPPALRDGEWIPVDRG